MLDILCKVRGFAFSIAGCLPLVFYLAHDTIKQSLVYNGMHADGKWAHFLAVVEPAIVCEKESIPLRCRTVGCPQACLVSTA